MMQVLNPQKNKKKIKIKSSTHKAVYPLGNYSNPLNTFSIYKHERQKKSFVGVLHTFCNNKKKERQEEKKVTSLLGNNCDEVLLIW